MNRKQRIDKILSRKLNEFLLEIIDNSNLHKGHNNFKGNDETHIKIILTKKNNHSLKHFQNYLSKLLKKNQIGFDSSNDQFQLNTIEMYEKLWPRMRQIVRHAQMRSKSNKWVPIPV